MLAALAGLATAVAGALLLFPRYGHVGVAAAIGGAGWVGAAILIVALARRGWLQVDADFRRRLPRIIAATLVMGSALLAFKALATSSLGTPQTASLRLVLLALWIPGGLLVYLAALQILGAARLNELVAAVRHRH
jgi:putative peptidoglycan lipid II flippase